MKKYGVIRSEDLECPECGAPLHKIQGKWVCLDCDRVPTEKGRKLNKPARKNDWK